MNRLKIKKAIIEKRQLFMLTNIVELPGEVETILNIIRNTWIIMELEVTVQILLPKC